MRKSYTCFNSQSIFCGCFARRFLCFKSVIHCSNAYASGRIIQSFGKLSFRFFIKGNIAPVPAFRDEDFYFIPYPVQNPLYDIPVAVYKPPQNSLVGEHFLCGKIRHYFRLHYVLQGFRRNAVMRRRIVLNISINVIFIFQSFAGIDFL